jgi:hypothetical protein
MGTLHLPDPVLLVVAAFSRYPEALAWAGQQLQAVFGPTEMVGQPFEFNQTRYYEATMGPGLQKQFLAFGLVAADTLAHAKVRANALEQQLADAGTYPEPRPLNLDPGILSLGKFMLATTKDQAHRIYLNQGIYAEATLRYEDGAFHPWPWTYADYRQQAVLDFVGQLRDHYRQRLRERRASGKG